MVFDEPQSRNEAILQNLLGADNVLVNPESRIEAILQSILNETAYLEEPQSRMEELLLAVKDDGSYDDEARSRNEAIIIAWLNDEEYTEEPQSRIEELLIAWLASIPKYVLKTVTGTTPITVTDAVNQHIVSLVQTGKAVQSGTPTPSAPVDIVCNNGVLKWDSVNQHIYADGTPEVLTISGTDHMQTASVQDLCGVGNVADEQDIISGAVTHRIGYHVFYGTETFSKSTAYGKAFLINAASSAWGADRIHAVLCTHFLGLPQTSGSQEDNTCFFNQTGHFYFRVTDNSDANAFKAWLAEQYAAGTPVIVAYALSEETSETVTAQHLETANGSNTISVISEVGQVNVAMTYRAKAGD